MTGLSAPNYVVSVFRVSGGCMLRLGCVCVSRVLMGGGGGVGWGVREGDGWVRGELCCREGTGVCQIFMGGDEGSEGRGVVLQRGS